MVLKTIRTDGAVEVIIIGEALLDLIDRPGGCWRYPRQQPTNKLKEGQILCSDFCMTTHLRQLLLVSDLLTLIIGKPWTHTYYSWHGRNFNALRDSIIAGQINQIELPYMIRISGLDKMPPGVKKLVQDFCNLIQEFHSEGHDVDAVC